MKKSARPFENKAVSLQTTGTGVIRVGIGGWSYAPWRETFYPVEVPQSRALEYASRQFSAIEINSTFYGTQRAETFAKWHDQTPDGFVFSLKAPRVATHRTNLDDASAAVDRFLGSGLDRLGSKLGPLVWQFAPTKPFRVEEFARFLNRLPRSVGRQPLRHVLDVRHPTFASAEFVALAREQTVSIVHTDAVNVPQIADVTAGCVYLRLREARLGRPHGYTPTQLKRWLAAALEWSAGRLPDKMKDLSEAPPPKPRDVFVYFINGAKERAPAAARYFSDQLARCR